MPVNFRLALAGIAAVNGMLAVAFAFRMPWVLGIWPWSTGRLTYIFIGSIFAAVAAAIAWIAVSGERGSLPAGFLNLGITSGGIGGFLLIEGIATETTQWIVYGVIALLLAAANAVGLLRTIRTEAVQTSPLPWPVWTSFILFSALLVFVGGSLILQRDGIMPWPLDPYNSVGIGWIFFGAAFYFLYSLLRPNWHAARAQLWGFLAYDVVLIVPFIGHLSTVPSDLRLNLIIYIAVLIYSASIAIYYVILNPETRGWAEKSSRPAEP